MKMYRQGDLLFVECNEIPGDAEKIDTGILARGEATGHHHSLRSSARNVALMAAGVAYVQAPSKAHIDHQEHHTITLPAGNWAVRRQREYTPDGWRTVLD